MSPKIYSYAKGWEWHILKQSTPEDMIKQCPEAANWLLHLLDNSNPGILISHQNTDDIVIQGTLSIPLSEDEQDVQPLHFRFSKTKLVTVHQDNRIPIRLQNLNHTKSYEQCKTAPEAFCVMINVLLEYLHIGLDQFQTKLGELEQKVRMHNRKDLLDDIIERRYDLLHYSHLFLPFREFEGILREAFLGHIEHEKSFIRLQHRFERLDTLIKHYAIEIDTLLSVDDAISSMRGNEIIRTLTIFTVLCLPATILGAIWGSNFDWLPFKDEPLGFIYLVLTIFLITASLSFLLWKKGWTGDIISPAKLKTTRKKRNKALQVADIPTPVDSLVERMGEPLPPRKQRGKASQSALSTKQFNQQDILNEDLPKRSNRRK